MSSPAPSPPDPLPSVKTEERATDPSAPYEARDVRISTVLWLMASILLGAAVAHWGVWWLWHESEIWARDADPSISPLTDVRQIPPEPRLQATPLRDYADFHRSQEQLLQTYGWVDQEAGVVRIPIERSFELLLERGLPEPDPETPDSESGSRDQE